MSCLPKQDTKNTCAYIPQSLSACVREAFFVRGNCRPPFLYKYCIHGTITLRGSWAPEFLINYINQITMKTLVSTALFTLIGQAAQDEKRLFTDRETQSAYDEFVDLLESVCESEPSPAHLLRVLNYTRMELIALQKKRLTWEAKKKCGRLSGKNDRNAP